MTRRRGISRLEVGVALITLAVLAVIAAPLVGSLFSSPSSPTTAGPSE